MAMTEPILRETPPQDLPSLDTRKHIVILTGAGISAESGLSTFRDNNGLWCNHKVEDVATPHAFHSNPTLVHAFYNQRRQQLQEVAPNAAHLALAALERRWHGSFLLITQNVDDLHDRAGSSNLLHMHGELLKARCVHSGEIFAWNTETTTTLPCPCCGKPGALRPHIVWFGEMPLDIDRIFSSLQTCDIFLSIGTSGNVYPAAGFVAEAKMHGATTFELNMERSESPYFDHGFYGAATQLIPELVRKAK